MEATSNLLQELLTERDVARITGMSIASVRRWRLFRQGPTYLKIGAAVLLAVESLSVRPKPEKTEVVSTLSTTVEQSEQVQ